MGPLYRYLRYSDGSKFCDFSIAMCLNFVISGIDMALHFVIFGVATGLKLNVQILLV